MFQQAKILAKSQYEMSSSSAVHKFTKKKILDKYLFVIFLISMFCDYECVYEHVSQAKRRTRPTLSLFQSLPIRRSVNLIRERRRESSKIAKGSVGKSWLSIVNRRLGKNNFTHSRLTLFEV